jgi:hypothetical protein
MLGAQKQALQMIVQKTDKIEIVACQAELSHCDVLSAPPRKPSNQPRELLRGPIPDSFSYWVP